LYSNRKSKIFEIEIFNVIINQYKDKRNQNLEKNSKINSLLNIIAIGKKFSSRKIVFRD
jgi:hypothetical protein